MAVDNYDINEQTTFLQREITRLRADLALNASMLAKHSYMARVADAAREKKELLEVCKLMAAVKDSDVLSGMLRASRAAKAAIVRMEVE